MTGLSEVDRVTSRTRFTGFVAPFYWLKKYGRSASCENVKACVGWVDKGQGTGRNGDKMIFRAESRSGGPAPGVREFTKNPYVMLLVFVK